MSEVKNKFCLRCAAVKASVRLILVGFFYFAAFGLVAEAQFVDLTRNNQDAIMHQEWVTQIVSAPSGKKFVSSGVDGHIVISDASTGKVLSEIVLPTIVLTLSLSNDGRMLAAGDATGTVSLIETESGKIKNRFTADKNIVNTSAFSEDGKFLAAGGSDGVVRVWSVRDEKITEEINPAHGNIVSLAFANSQLVIGAVNFKERKGSIEVWDWQNKTSVRVFDEGTPALRGLSISPDGKLLAAANFRPASLLFVLPGEGSSAEISLRLVPDADEATPVTVWDLTTGKRVALIESEVGARSIAFSPDGKMLACAGANGAMLYDTGSHTFAEIGRIDSLTAIDAVAFSNDSEQLLIAREREPLVRFGAGGIDKLFDPFFTNVTMVVRDGAVPTFTKGTGTKASTGGSNIEIWQIRRRTAVPDTQTWDALRASFDDKPEEARKILRQVIKDFPNYGEAQRLYAIFFEANDLKKLQSLLEASVKSDPNCISCWRSLGDVEHNTDQEIAAAQTYEHVLQLKPEYGLVTGHLADAYGNLALALISAGNNEKNMAAAAEALNRALTLRPAEESFYTNLGVVYYFRGDFDKDLALLLIAQKLHPDHARIYYNLGHAYRYKKDKPKALEAYRRYVRMGEAGEQDRIERAKEYIKQLSK